MATDSIPVYELGDVAVVEVVDSHGDNYVTLIQTWKGDRLIAEVEANRA